ncbi:periplasmic component of amino acid ABC-type transporter/signal transduction system [Saccharomonospora marina XMU15]|uniref:Periplasmic component of amino acid ABC-type transporter/signal transduction system n=1 Tax=Saccharomonospora marina XMU15 TaxID=882083 RepID=H5X535_9PSEU|nr:glutamate ABC transporter substrate-binding protein [Saccharomonospora marina]EHR53367.1 periplasmic component of amino acid ABC-type transporter/signal transduction system [Saccharomonospora marina XMU15]
MRTARPLLSLLSLLAVLLAGCASPGAPVDPAPIGTPQRPMPPNAVIGADVEGGGSGDSDCDPAASLSPNGAISAGSTMAEIKQRGYLKAGVDQNTFLFGFRDPTTGRLEGFDIDIAKEIARAIFDDPDAIQFRAISSAQRDTALVNGDVDIVVRTYSITCQRLQKVGFSTVYYVAGQRVLVKQNSKVAGIGDLAGKRVCATKESTSLENIANSEPKPVPVSVDDWSDCLVMLQQGQVDAVSTDDTILAGMAEQDPTTKIVGDRFTEELYGVGVPKENEDMVRFVNAVLEDIRGGAWQSSYDNWLRDRLGPASPPAPRYR